MEIWRVSSDTTIAIASVSSVTPIAARWRVPRLRSSAGFVVSGRKARRRRDPIALNNHCAVMQRAAGVKDAAQKVARNHRVQGDAAFNKRAQTDFALHHDQRAGFQFRHLLACARMISSTISRRSSCPPNPSHWLRPIRANMPPDFGLEHDDQRDGGIGRNRGEHATQELEMRPHRDQVDRPPESTAR